MKFIHKIWEERSTSPFLSMLVVGSVLCGAVLFTTIRELGEPGLSAERRAVCERDLRYWYLFFLGGSFIGFCAFKMTKIFDKAATPPTEEKEKFVGEDAKAQALKEDESADGVLLTETSRGDFYYTLKDREIFNRAMDWRVFDNYREGLAERDPSWIYEGDESEETDVNMLEVLELIKKGKERELTVVEQKKLGKFDSENPELFSWFGSPIDVPEDYRDGFVKEGHLRSAHGMLMLLHDGELNECGQKMVGSWLARCQPELAKALVGIADVPERARSLRVVLGSFFELASEPGKEIGESSVTSCTQIVHRQLLAHGEQEQASSLKSQARAAYPDIEL